MAQRKPKRKARKPKSSNYQNKPVRSRKKTPFDITQQRTFEFEGFPLSMKPAEYLAWKAMSKLEKKKHVAHIRGLVNKKILKKENIHYTDENGIKVPTYIYVPYNFTRKHDI